MRDIEVSGSESSEVERVEMMLEAVVIPVSDVDRAKAFYGGLGWRLDADFAFDNGFRGVQFTPPGSGCSIQFGTKKTSAAPGSAQGLYLIVTDISAARNALLARGVEVSEVFHPETPGAQFELGERSGRASGPAPDHESYGSFATFSDPDGNGWLVQEVTTRLPGHVDETQTTFASSADVASSAELSFSTVVPEQLEWTTRPHEPGEPARHVAELEGLIPFQHTRANVWRYDPGARGRRHVHADQEETFVVIAGRLTMYLGEPPERHVVPTGGVVHVQPGTPLQTVNEGNEDLVVYAYGSPPDEGAEVLPPAV